jgi:hypothetical protein
MEVTRVTGAPLGGVKFSIMEEFSFADKDAMESALASAEGKAVTRDLMTFAADLMTVFYGEAGE